MFVGGYQHLGVYLGRTETRAADWQVTRLAQLGESKREIKKAIKDTLGLSTKEVNHLYKDVLRKGYEREAELYKYKGRTQIPFAENKELQQLIGAVSKQTDGELKNITQSLGFAKRGADGKLEFTPVADYYQKTLDSAMFDISSGAFDYNTVLKRTVKEMTNSGLRSVDYATGHSNRVDVAARRALMTGMSQLTAKVNESNAEQLGTDTFEVTAHGGARPEHQEWQGKWYTKDELESICGLGEVTGLCGANCYHDYYPVVPGISEPTYTAEQIEEFNRKENEPVEYNGKKYTKYEATQRQRQLETTMRAQRQEIKLLKEGGASEDDLIAARSRYRGTSAEYARFSKAMDLPQQRERVTVDGLGNIGFIPSGKSLTNDAHGDIIGVVEDKKLTGFFLNADSKHGNEFLSVGYSSDKPDELKRDLLEALITSERDPMGETEFGERFSIDALLGVTKKRNFQLIWQIDKSTGIPRIITGHRRKKGRK